MKYTLVIPVYLLILLMPLSTFASDMWLNYTPNNIYSTLSSTIEDMSSASSFCIARNMLHYNSTTGEVKKYDLSSLTTGVLVPNNDTETYDVIASTTYTEFWNGEDGKTITANFVYKDDIIYVQFPETLALKSSWTSISKSDHKEFAIRLGYPMLFDDIFHDSNIIYRQTL